MGPLASHFILLLTLAPAAAASAPTWFNSKSRLIFQVLILMMLIAGCVIGFRWKQKRRAASPFKCTKCGYDLRAAMTPGPVTCPECGSVYE